MNYNNNGYFGERTPSYPSHQTYYPPQQPYYPHQTPSPPQQPYYPPQTPCPPQQPYYPPQTPCPPQQPYYPPPQPPRPGSSGMLGGWMNSMMGGGHYNYNYGCGMKTCDLCQGKGFLDQWGKPCTQTSMFKDRECSKCHARGEIPANSRKCSGCNGLGGLSKFGKPCKPTDMFFQENCQRCRGDGIINYDT